MRVALLNSNMGTLDSSDPSLLSRVDNPISKIAAITRTCRSKDTVRSVDLTHDVDETKDVKLVRKCIKNGETSILEHAVFTFLVEGLSYRSHVHSTRHRIASFIVASQRFLSMDSKNELITKYVEGDPVAKEELINSAYAHLNLLHKHIESGAIQVDNAAYLNFQGVSINMVVTINLRSLLNYFELRLCRKSSQETRELAHLIQIKVNEIFPDLKDFTLPKCSSCPLMESGKCTGYTVP